MSDTLWNGFNIHNIATIGVARKSPTTSLFQDMFEPFRADNLDHFDLKISGEYETLDEGAFGEIHGETEFDYTENGVNIHTPHVQVIRDGKGFRLNGKSELLVYALPLLDRIMVERNVAMLHALTVEYRNHGLCMPAWGGTGKTSTMAKLVKMDGFAFMGDDWAFLSNKGELLGYAKPMFIKPYHRPIYPHLFSKTHKPLVPIRLSKQIARMTTVVHPFITRYPQLARITRRWSPEHMMVTPRKAFPDAKFSTAAPLAASLFVERFESSSPAPQFVEKNRDWMVARLVGNFHSELPKYSRMVMTALGASGIVPVENNLAEKAEVIRAALDGKPAFLLRVPKALSPDQASDIIIEHIQKVLDAAGVR